MLHPLPPELPQPLMKIMASSDTLSKSDNSLTALLERFVNEKDEPMKNSILLFISTFSEKIFKNNLQSFDKIYETVLTHLPHCSFVFQGQIFVQLTTMALTLDLVHTKRELFEKFVNELILVISKANQSQDRILRQMGAECLNEIECHLPGLLEQHMKYLYILCQKECTHALQSYVNLLMRILLNRILLVAKGGGHRTMSSGEMSTISGDSLASTLSNVAGPSQRFQTFTVPPNILHRQDNTIPSDVDVEKLRLSSSKRIQRLVKDTRKILSFVITASRYFTVWGKAEVFRSLFDLVRFSDFPLDAVRSEFFRKCVYNNDIYLIHVFSEMQRKFQFEGVSRERNGRCIYISQDYLTSPFYRQIASLLIEKNPRKLNEMAPNVHDNLLSVHTKLVKMVSSFNKPPSNQVIQMCLKLLSDYEYYFDHNRKKIRKRNRGSKKINLRLLIIFDFLYQILDVFKSSKSVVLNYLLNMVRSRPKVMIFWLIKFIDRFEREHPNRSIQKSVLRTLEKKIRFNHSTFLSYVPLIQRILSDPQFQPEDLLRQIDRFIKGYDSSFNNNYSTSKDISKSGDWKMGRASLDCLTTAIRTHKSRILPQVNQTLQYISKFYNNEDVRDQAFFLLKLTNHVSKDRLEYFLSPIKKISLDSNNNNKNKEKEEEIEEIEGEDILQTIKKKKKEEVEKIDDLDSYEQANLAVKERIFQPFLKLKRVFKKEEMEEETEDESLDFIHKKKKKEDNLIEEEEEEEKRTYRVSDLETYRQLLFEVFSEPASEMMDGQEEEDDNSAIILFFEVSFDLIAEEPEIDTIYSLRIFFPKLPQFEEIREIKVPYLRSSRTNGLLSSSANSKKKVKAAGVGCSYFFKLPVHPLFPVGSIFKNIKVEFSSKKYAKCVSTVNPIEITLTDFFSPLPLKVTNESELWRILWKGEGFFESVKILSWRKYELERFIHKRLSQFLIDEKINKNNNKITVDFLEDDDDLLLEEEEEEGDDPDDFDDDSMNESSVFSDKGKKEKIEIKKVLIFLPPRYHLLLWFIIGEKNTKVKIKTDLFQVLAYLDDFFNTF